MQPPCDYQTCSGEMIYWICQGLCAEDVYGVDPQVGPFADTRHTIAQLRAGIFDNSLIFG